MNLNLNVTLRTNLWLNGYEGNGTPDKQISNPKFDTLVPRKVEFSSMGGDVSVDTVARVMSLSISIHAESIC
jgi:hypothetical protein